MLPLLLVLTLTQADVRTPVAVVLTSKRPGAEQVAPKISQRVLDSLKREGVGELLDVAKATRELRVAGFSDPRSCQGTRACLNKLAVLLGPHAVVIGVDVGRVGKTLAIHLDAVAADQEAALASLDVSSSLDGWSDAMGAPIVVFARDVKAGTVIKPALPEPPPPPLQTDTPVATHVEPRTGTTDPSLTRSGPGAVPKFVPWVLTGGAVAAAGVGITFGVLGLGNKSRYDSAVSTLPDRSKVSSLPEAQARSIAASANTDFTVALTSAIVSAALTGTAVWLFTRE